MAKTIESLGTQAADRIIGAARLLFESPAARTRKRGVVFISRSEPIGISPSGPVRRSNHNIIRGPLVP
jgi:hypothetical protein